jgi:hypothetical protein
MQYRKQMGADEGGRHTRYRYGVHPCTADHCGRRGKCPTDADPLVTVILSGFHPGRRRYAGLRLAHFGRGAHWRRDGQYRTLPGRLMSDAARRNGELRRPAGLSRDERGFRSTWSIRMMWSGRWVCSPGSWRPPGSPPAPGVPAPAQGRLLALPGARCQQPPQEKTRGPRPS